MRTQGRRDDVDAMAGPAVARRSSSPAEPLHELQRLAGNRAVAQLVTVQRAGPAPTPFERGAHLTGKELGHTQEVGVEMPVFKIETEPSTGKAKRGKVASTTKGKIDIETRYFGPGLHDDSPTETGMKQQLFIPDKVADKIKEAEQEHSDDIWWGHELVAGEAARAVNVLAAKEAREAPNIGALHRIWREELHNTIAKKLRITADASDPAKGGSVSGPWSNATATLQQSTHERDTNHWHDFPSRAATADERKKHNIPADVYLRVSEVSNEVGKHKSQPRMKAAWDALPDRP